MEETWGKWTEVEVGFFEIRLEHVNAQSVKSWAY